MLFLSCTSFQIFFFLTGHEYDFVFDWTVMRLQKLNKLSQSQNQPKAQVQAQPQPQPHSQPRFSVSFLSSTSQF